MKWWTIQRENVNTGHAATIIAPNVQNGIPFYRHKPGDVVSICQSPHRQLSAVCQTDCTQTLLQLVFQRFQVIKSGLCLSFCSKFFHRLVSSKSSSLYRFSKIKCDSHCTDPFPWLVSSDVDCCNGNKVSWYTVLSKFTHSHLSWSSIIPYLLPPSFTIHVILLVQFTSLTVFFYNLSPSFLWSTFWTGTLHTPYISSSNDCFLFAAHAITTATSFAVVPKLCHLNLIIIYTEIGIQTGKTRTF